MESSNKVIINKVYGKENSSTLIDFAWYISLSCACVLFTVVIVTVLKMLWPTGEKRSTQQRQTYSPDPTVYVTPATLVPPPNYELLAPPSYEEAIKKLSSNSQLNIQPILHPITSELNRSLMNDNSSSGNSNKTTSNKNSTTGIPFVTSTSITIGLVD